MIAHSAWGHGTRLLRAVRRSGVRYTAGRVLDEALNALSALAGGDALPKADVSSRLTLLVLPNIDWRFRTQRAQQLSQALARRGCTVFYVQPSTVRAKRAGFRIHWKRDGLTCLCAFGNRRGALADMWCADGAAVATSLNALIGRVRSNGRPVYALVQHPFWAAVAASLTADKIFFDCLDDYTDFGDNEAENREAVVFLGQLSDGIVATSALLCEECAIFRRPSRLVRNGCLYEPFATPGHVRAAGGAGKNGGRIIGYHGAIENWFDVEAVRAIARAFPEDKVVLVGGDGINARDALRCEKNVYFTGEVSFGDLPRHVASFSVGILPFQVRGLTQKTNPVKIYEYLAAGKPVAAPPLPEMEAFGDLVRVVGKGGWEAAIRDCLALPAEAGRRRAFAAANTWDHRAQELLEFMTDCPVAPDRAHLCINVGN